MGVLKSQNSINTLLAEGRLLNSLIVGDDVCVSASCFSVACRFIVVHPCFIMCDNPLQESLSLSMILLQKLYAYFHGYPFVLLHELLQHPPCTDSVITKVLMDDGIYRSTADVQLVSCIRTVIHLSS